MNRILKSKIVERFGTQADFAQVLDVDESVVSRVVRGRRKLKSEDAIQWAKTLKCDPKVLEPAID